MDTIEKLKEQQIQILVIESNYISISEDLCIEGQNGEL